MVRAKFKCTIKAETGDTTHIVLEPVVTGSKENEDFYKYTPAGRIDLGVVNKAAADQFEQGKEYYIDFKPVEI
jgi:hypothetical protein